MAVWVHAFRRYTLIDFWKVLTTDENFNFWKVLTTDDKYGSFPKTCHTYPTSDETWHSHTLPKKGPKNIRIT